MAGASNPCDLVLASVVGLHITLQLQGKAGSMKSSKVSVHMWSSACLSMWHVRFGMLPTWRSWPRQYRAERHCRAADCHGIETLTQELSTRRPVRMVCLSARQLQRLAAQMQPISGYFATCRPPFSSRVSSA